MCRVNREGRSVKGTVVSVQFALCTAKMQNTYELENNVMWINPCQISQGFVEKVINVAILQFWVTLINFYFLNF